MTLGVNFNHSEVVFRSDAAIGVRKRLRTTFSRSVERGEYPTAWSLRLEFVELLQRDTYLVLGYKPEKVDSFLGLPIIICPAGSPDQLITETGSMTVAQLKDVWPGNSHAND